MIIGKKILLRLFQNEHEILEVYKSYNNLSERDVNDHTEIFQTKSKIRKFQETGLWTNSEGELLIVTKEDEIVGTVSFLKTSEFAIEIGYRIFKEEHRKKGYMSEALPLFSHYLFETVPNITRLEVRISSENEGSRKLVAKCGYKQEGILRQAYFFRGRMTDFVIYSILRNEISLIENNA